MSFTQAVLDRLRDGDAEALMPRTFGDMMGAGVCRFDATDGVAVGAHSLDLVIPANSFVLWAFYHVRTTFTSAGADAGTIALSVASANDLTTATAISAGGNVWDAGGLVECTPDNTVGNAIEVTADSTVTATVATQALTAGVLDLWVYWANFGGVAS